MSGPLLHLAVVLVALAALAIAGLEAWHAIASSLEAAL